MVTQQCPMHGVQFSANASDKQTLFLIGIWVGPEVLVQPRVLQKLTTDTYLLIYLATSLSTNTATGVG